MAAAPVDRTVNHAVALALGVAAQLLSPSLEPHAPAFLAALCLACLLDLVRPRRRDAVTAAALVLLALWAPFAAFGPLVAALAATSRRRWVRLAWLVPAAVSLAPMGPTAAAGLALLEAVAFALAVRSEAAAAEHAALTALRDGLRERVIALDEENTALADEAARTGATGTAPAAAAKAALEGLTDRERSVLALVAEGLDNREVAGRLYLSEGTVRNHVSAILRKKQLHNRAQLVSLYYRGPVVTP